jgi:hypothetical protein
LRSRSKLARPNMARLRVLILLRWPSTALELCGRGVCGAWRWVAVWCAVPPLPLLTSDDLDELGAVAFDADDPLAVAAQLADAVEQARVADKANVGYALMLAAEITERAQDLDAALVLAERAVEAYRVHGDGEYGYPRSFRAGLLLRLGREDEALAELAGLRRLLTQDPDAVSYVSEALEAGGRAEIAEQWLSAALETALERRETLAAEREDPAYGRAAVLAYALAQQRHRIRRDLDLPHDENDELADRLRDAVDGVLADEYDDDDDDNGGLAALFWPRGEFEALLQRWPGLARAYGSTWDEHRDMVQRGLQMGSQAGLTGLAVLTGRVDGLVGHAAAVGGDAADAQVREGYAEDLPARPWPPGRNEPCWCGSGVKYKKCCPARVRT